jgi:predicted GIY-YIG superfamily endonuclease
MGVRVVESFSAKALSNLVSMQSCEPRKQAIRDEDDLQSVDRVWRETGARLKRWCGGTSEECFA